MLFKHKHWEYSGGYAEVHSQEEFLHPLHLAPRIREGGYIIPLWSDTPTKMLLQMVQIESNLAFTDNLPISVCKNCLLDQGPDCGDTLSVLVSASIPLRSDTSPLHHPHPRR